MSAWTQPSGSWRSPSLISMISFIAITLQRSGSPYRFNMSISLGLSWWTFGFSERRRILLNFLPVTVCTSVSTRLIMFLRTGFSDCRSFSTNFRNLLAGIILNGWSWEITGRRFLCVGRSYVSFILRL